MSKKNNKSTKKRAHSFALRREADDAAKRKVTQEKKAAKAMKNPGVKKAQPKKKKGLRIRKNVVIRGVKVKDAETKKKVKKILAAEAAMREMQVDGDEAAVPVRRRCKGGVKPAAVPAAVVDAMTE